MDIYSKNGQVSITLENQEEIELFIQIFEEGKMLYWEKDYDLCQIVLDNLQQIN